MIGDIRPENILFTDRYEPLGRSEDKSQEKTNKDEISVKLIDLRHVKVIDLAEDDPMFHP